MSLFEHDIWMRVSGMFLAFTALAAASEAWYVAALCAIVGMLTDFVGTTFNATHDKL